MGEVGKMKKVTTKNDAVYHIMRFGRDEERNLIAEGKRSDAFQIEDARRTLVYCLANNPLKEIGVFIDRMTDHTIDENGRWHYDGMFVADDLTRELLKDLRQKFK